jgi:hypothetical protein
MHIPDIWSLVTGIASIISLFLSAGETFASWRKYTVPVAATLGGFALGRISPFISSGMGQLFMDPRSAGFLFLIFLIVASLALVSYFFMRHGHLPYAYLVFTIGIFSVPTTLLPMYSKIVDSIPPGDMVKLAQIKASAGEYEQAIKYLESARDKTNNEVLKKELERLIISLSKEAAKVSIGAGKVNKASPVNPVAQ